MADICLCLHVHEPFVLRRYSVFDSEPDYFDAAFAAQRIAAMARTCYGPVNSTLLDVIRRTPGAFRLSLSITGLALELLSEFAPEILQQFRDLVALAEVEILGTTYYHSFSSLFSADEFTAQVAMHQRMMQRMFGREPRTFRPAALLPDAVASDALMRLGFTTVLGHAPVRAPASVSGLYRAAAGLCLLAPRPDFLRDVLSFSAETSGQSQEPRELVRRLFAAAPPPAAVLNLFMNYEMLSDGAGDAALLPMLEALPQAATEAGIGFKHPAELTTNHDAVAVAMPRPTFSPETDGADGADHSELPPDFFGNAMQVDAAARLYAARDAIAKKGDGLALENWRRLTSADHLFYMATPQSPPGAAGRAVSPFDSPYDAYIYFMNILDNLEARAQGRRPAGG